MRRDTRRPDRLLLQVAFPPYRQEFLKRLLAEGRWTVLLGSARRHDGVTDGVFQLDLDGVRQIRNVFFFRRRLLWQHGAAVAATRARVTVLDHNPRNLSTWAILVARVILRRPSLLWGHAFSRELGAGPLRQTIRRAQLSLADGYLSYTQHDADALERRRLAGHVWATGNGIWSVEQMAGRASPRGQPTRVVYSGRLVARKQVLDLPTIIDCACSRDPQVGFDIVGAGPLGDELRREVDRLDLTDRITFHDAVWDLDALSDIYSRAFCAISPGYTGLNVIQALSFGVPFVTPRTPAVRHAPEIEALRHKVNGYLVDEKSPEAFVDAIMSCRQWGRDPCSRAQMQELALHTYSTNSMTEAFASAVRSVS